MIRKSFDRGLLQILHGRQTKGAQVDAAQQVQVKKPAHLYGCRGTDPELVYLSPYEFERWWDIAIKSTKSLALKCVKEFPRRGQTQILADHWVMVKRVRPRMPVFHGCPMPAHRKGMEERNSRILLAYVHPWVIAEEDAMEHVPVVMNLASGKDGK